MRRDQFTTNVRAGDNQKPTLEIVYDGSDDMLDEQLLSATLTGTDIDAAFRLLAPLSTNSEGVFSLTHRLTGAYLLEVNMDVEDILQLIGAAREADEDASYCVRLQHEESIIYELSALLVYDSDGELLRQRSLIPSGVEL